METQTLPASRVWAGQILFGAPSFKDDAVEPASASRQPLAIFGVKQPFGFGFDEPSPHLGRCSCWRNRSHPAVQDRTISATLLAVGEVFAGYTIVRISFCHWHAVIRDSRRA